MTVYLRIIKRLMNGDRILKDGRGYYWVSNGRRLTPTEEEIVVAALRETE